MAQSIALRCSLHRDLIAAAQFRLLCAHLRGRRGRRGRGGGEVDLPAPASSALLDAETIPGLFRASSPLSAGNEMGVTGFNLLGR